MHFKMLVTLEMCDEATSLDTRAAVYDRLLEDDSFCGEGGRFRSRLCDWFVIGGRWSGCLTETAIGKAYPDKLKTLFPKLAGDYYRTADAKANAEALDALWRECGGQPPSPFNRSAYELDGYEDDAMPLTRELYDALLAEHAGESCHAEDGHCQFTDLDDECLDETFIGRKWLVVVDYHN